MRNLAILNGVSEQAIRLANQGRDLSALEPGDELCIPPQQLSCVSGDLYTVQRGDTFSSIAERFGITTLELSERNPFVDPSNLRSGEVLCVPETVATPTPPEDLPTPSLPSTPSRPSTPSTPDEDVPGGEDDIPATGAALPIAAIALTAISAAAVVLLRKKQ